MNSNKNLKNIDWSFSSVNNVGIHSFHWYPATYVAAVPATLIASLSEEGSTILDPFCGSGTSGLEALRLGNSFVGMDTNPIALLISEAKLYYPDPPSFYKKMLGVVEEAHLDFSQSKSKKHPQEKELRGWYHPETCAELYSILLKIIAMPRGSNRRCALAIFSSILKSMSSQGKHWGWVCDNVKPKPEGIIYKNAISAFLIAVEDYLSSSKASFRMLKEVASKDTRADIRKNFVLYQGDCVEQMLRLEESSVDMIMTSPPYYGVADYIKSQRLSYLWFDLDELSDDKLGFRDFNILRSHEKGARSNRSKKNSRRLYLDFIAAFFRAASYVLKPGSYMSLIVGESKARGATTEALIVSAIMEGFELTLRRQREIKATRRRLMASVKGEEVLIFRN